MNLPMFITPNYSLSVYRAEAMMDAFYNDYDPICPDCGENSETSDCHCASLVEDEFASRGFDRGEVLRCEFYENGMVQVATPDNKRPVRMSDDVTYVLFDEDDNIVRELKFSTCEEFLSWYGKR